MLTAAVREVRFVQYLGADHTLVVIREILHEVILRHFALRYHMIKAGTAATAMPKCTGNSGNRGLQPTQLSCDKASGQCVLMSHARLFSKPV